LPKAKKPWSRPPSGFARFKQYTDLAGMPSTASTSASIPAQPEEDLRVSLVQTELHWEDPQANRKAFDALLAPLKGATDLVLLPEAFTTGFIMEPEGVAERWTDPDGPEGPCATLAWMQQQAASLDAAIAGSVMLQVSDAESASAEASGYANRLLFVQPDGRFAHYDKRHLFRYAGEDRHFRAGQKRLLVAWKGWRICPLICYDLRFPVWARNGSPADPGHYDLLVYVANWPARRNVAWQRLLPARAIENMAWTIGLNRVGQDGNGIDYAGASVVLDPLGDALWGADHEACVHTAALSAERLRAVRAKYPFLDDRDAFTLG
jgi:predicted amidohydrolase